jgi:phosphomannomutase
MKFVREESRPISGDTGLFDIKALAERNQFTAAAQPGKMYSLDTSQAYVEHLLSYVDVGSLKPLKVVVDAGNGGAGRVVDLLEPYLPFEFIKLHHEADGNFPNGVPNPLLPENRAAAIAAVREHGAAGGCIFATAGSGAHCARPTTNVEHGRYCAVIGRRGGAV